MRESGGVERSVSRVDAMESREQLERRLADVEKWEGGRCTRSSRSSRVGLQSAGRRAATAGAFRSTRSQAFRGRLQRRIPFNLAEAKGYRSPARGRISTFSESRWVPGLSKSRLRSRGSARSVWLHTSGREEDRRRRRSFRTAEESSLRVGGPSCRSRFPAGHGKRTSISTSRSPPTCPRFTVATSSGAGPGPPVVRFRHGHPSATHHVYAATFASTGCVCRRRPGRNHSPWAEPPSVVLPLAVAQRATTPAAAEPSASTLWPRRLMILKRRCSFASTASGGVCPSPARNPSLRDSLTLLARPRACGPPAGRIALS